MRASVAVFLLALALVTFACGGSSKVAMVYILIAVAVMI
jgi:hypothetical protein